MLPIPGTRFSFSAYHPLQTESRQRISTLTVFLWARVDYASRAAKNSPLGCFCPFFCDGAAAVRIHPHENPSLLQTENRQRISTSAVFLWARVDSNKLNYHNSLDAL